MAAQYLFGTLPLERSRAKREGNQTIASTRGAFTEADVLEMQPRLFLSAAPIPTRVAEKRLYFRLSSGRFVVAQVVSTDMPGQASRTGNYLAHALVLAERDMAELGFDPFVVFRGHRFQRTLASGERGGDDLPPVTLAPGALVRDDPPPITGAESGVLELAMRSEAMRKQERSLALVGDPDWALRLLESLLWLLPPDLRRVCTFDSWCEGVQAGRLGYWAIGIPSAGSAPYGAVVYRQGGRPLPVPAGLGPVAPADRWVVDQARAGRPPRRSDQSLAAALREWLAGAEPLASGPPLVAAALGDPQAAPLLRELAAGHRTRLCDLQLDRLRWDIGNHLARRIEPEVRRALERDPLECLRSAVLGIPAAQIDRLVCHAAIGRRWRGRLADDLDRHVGRMLDRAQASPPAPVDLLKLLAHLGAWARMGLLATPGEGERGVNEFAAGQVGRLDVDLAHRLRTTRRGVHIVTSIRAWDRVTGADRTALVAGLALAMSQDLSAPVGRTPFGGRRPAALRWPPTERFIGLLAERMGWRR